MSPRCFAMLMVVALWLGLGPGSVSTFPQASGGVSQRLSAPSTSLHHGAILSATKGFVHESPLAKNGSGATVATVTAGAHCTFYSGRLAFGPGLLADCHSLQAQRVRWQI